ncbi:hypothetical protein CCHR01_09446 [Colletotrichum chrysophilum]|uniref:Uncharacterized protein n=1 Tax=Colletotrichum chrysophilum TaxID=1836956 RepID=A0AAD9EHR4_9PEZI|nr:hypothetical protein CCHR01_09446 [Colletotrichum chrysophilum]
MICLDKGAGEGGGRWWDERAVEVLAKRGSGEYYDGRKQAMWRATTEGRSGTVVWADRRRFRAAVDEPQTTGRDHDVRALSIPQLKTV